MLEEIYALALTFLGGAGEDAALRAACKAAEAELGAKLKPGVSPEDCSDSFVCAAAWLALAVYGAAETGGAEQFSVADVSIKKGGGAASKALRAQAESLMAPWCAAGAFQFLGVRA